VGGPQGELNWGIHFSLAPTWLDPAEFSGLVTPLLTLYALHDAMLKPMPGMPLAPCLAESWLASEDGLIYDFVLRDGATFHNGEPVTAEDVRFSFHRYRGGGRSLMNDRIVAVDTPDRRHVRFRLKGPWPDFPTFYSAAGGAGWIVPKAYVEKVGDDGFKKAPIGAGPYRFVSFTPGVSLVLEAFEQYWRKVPNVRRLTFKVIPDDATRLAALTRGDVDIAYQIRGELARQVQRTPGLTLKPMAQGTQWLDFPEQWDASSPWHDARLRQAANLAIDRDTINQALTLGYSHVTGSIVPDDFEFYWAPPPPVHYRAKARQLLAEAGYTSGLDAGYLSCDSSYANVAEVVLNNLVEVGISARLRPLERAAFLTAWREKKLRNLLLGQSGALGNAATRLELFDVKGGMYAYGSYPDIDELFLRQAVALDRAQREVLLHMMQQLVHERTVHAPIFQPAFIGAYGPRLSEPCIGLIPEFPYSAPYEDITLKRT
jgi:peptide/nickel transport system substrate-binding protein